nr:MAG TPA: hypothetical protein [Caudoviricetes sp.]
MSCYTSLNKAKQKKKLSGNANFTECRCLIK